MANRFLFVQTCLVLATDDEHINSGEVIDSAVVALEKDSATCRLFERLAQQMTRAYERENPAPTES